MHEISVVLGTLNRLQSLRRAIDSVVAGTRRPFRLYIIDAGSTDGTVAYLRSLPAERCEVILETERRGQAISYNDVFKRLESRYSCWLSDDNALVGGGLDAAAAILDENPGFGMVGLKVKDLQGPFAAAPYIGGVSSIGILNVNQGMLRTPLLRELGGFSEEFRDYGIDPDLTVRVLLAGYDVAYTRSVALHHYRDWGPGPQSPQFRQQMERQQRYQDLYRGKYGHLGAGAYAWKLKKALWSALRALASQRFIDSPRPVFGALPRDWQNAFCARYISVLDPVSSSGSRHHLLQRAPAPRRGAIR